MSGALYQRQHKGKLLFALSSEFKNDPDSALKWLHLALELSEKINWQYGTTRSCNQIGGINYNKGNYSIALKFYQRVLDGLEIMESDLSQSQPDLIKLKRSQTYNNIGIVYKEVLN